MSNESTSDINNVATGETLFETGEYRMGSGRFVVEMFYSFAAPWMLALVLCAIAGIVVGLTVDIRWLIVGLMVVFVVAPMLMAFLYYYVGLRREAFVNTVPHRLKITTDGVEATMYFQLKCEEPADESREEQEFEVKKESGGFYPYESLSPLKIGLNSATTAIKSPARGFLWIPVSAFESEAEFVTAIQMLDYNIHVSNGLPTPFDIETLNTNQSCQELTN